MKVALLRQRISAVLGPRVVSLIVLLHGIFIIVLSLADQLVVHHHRLRITDLSLDITLATGLTVIYLSTLLSRRKRTGLIATAIAYTFYLGANLEGLSDVLDIHHNLSIKLITRALILPVVILLLLFINRQKFVVRSDSQGFGTAVIVSLVLLIVTFVYGTVGFYVLGQSGFHQKLSIPAAMHYTVDQLNVTTNHAIRPYDNRATLFSDSLSFITIFAILYVLIAFVQPLRARFGDQSSARAKFKELLDKQHDSISEDFFKLWPHDKQYFFDSTGESGLAFHVYHGSALVVGGPAGKKARYRQLLSEFQYVCWGNDWRPAIIHCDDALSSLYKDLDYNLQKIGEEAIVNLHKFTSETVKDKYFRNIDNRFSKQGYSFEVLMPPHHPAVINRLKEVSDQWLSRGNHLERGFALGYFTNQYMEMCPVAVARDGANTIQAFLNLIPADFDKEEATYDLLRASNIALTNANDFLVINTCRYLLEAGYTRFNLGLCPLVGLKKDEKDEEDSGIISSFLGFAYANGDKVYSFSGLYRFKNKYRPDWKARYVAYKGGIAGFSKSMNALMRVMSLTAKHHQRYRF